MLDSFCGGIMAAGAGRHRRSGFGPGAAISTCTAASAPLNGAGLDQGPADSPAMSWLRAIRQIPGGFETKASH
jgi:hypothetical protein